MCYATENMAHNDGGTACFESAENMKGAMACGGNAVGVMIFRKAHECQRGQKWDEGQERSRIEGMERRSREKPK